MEMGTGATAFDPIGRMVRPIASDRYPRTTKGIS